MNSLGKYIISLLLVLLIVPVMNENSSAQDYKTADEIIEGIDKNMFSTTIVYTARMIIHHRDRSDEKVMRTWGEGEDKGFTEFLEPARDKGTKYLKIDDDLWMYLPNIEKVIKISGHLLRQSMMGSDFSYEDSMEQTKLRENYDAVLIGEEEKAGSMCYILELTANKKDVTYYRRKIWVDKKTLIAMESQRFAKTGKLLKMMTVQKVAQFDGRYYPVHMTMEDKLRKNSKTEFIVEDPQFNVKIPARIFTRRNLEKK